MAVNGLHISVDAKSRSLVERGRSFLRDTVLSSFVAWVGVVALSAAAVKWVLPDRVLAPSTPVFACVMMLAATAGLLACLYCFAIFILTRQINHLLLAAAFATMGSGTVLQSILDIRYALPHSEGWLLTASWVISGALFLGSSHAGGLWKAVNRKQAIVQIALAAFMVTAFPLTAIPYVHSDSLIMSLETATNTIGWSVVGSVINAGVLVLLVMAVSAHFRRVRMHHDRMSSLLCYFLVPYGAGIMCSSATAVRFDEWWAVGQVLACGAWAVFIIVGSIENAFAHREAAERLVELEMLHDVSWSLVGAGTFWELLDMVASTLRERLRAGIAVVYLADEARETLEVAAVSGPKDYPVTIGAQYQTTSANRWPGFHSGHTVKALFAAQTQIVRDVFIDVEFVPWKQIATDDGCAVSLPLVHHGTAIGVVNIYFTNWRQVTRQRLKLLGTITAAVTPTIMDAWHRDQRENEAAHSDELDAAA